MLHRSPGHRFKNPALYANGPPQPPKNTGEAQYQLPLHCGLSVVIGNDRGFEGLIVLGILEISNDRFGGQPMAHGIAARVFLAFLSGWAGALKRVAPVGHDLLQRTHGYSTHKIGFVLLVASALQSVLERCCFESPQAKLKCPAPNLAAARKNRTLRLAPQLSLVDLA